MGNQYSITVSEEADHTLKELKRIKIMPSQAIDEAIKLIGLSGLSRLITLRRRIKHLEGLHESPL